MTYHGIVKWTLINDDEVHYSSFSIERGPGVSYAITRMQFTNRFQEKMVEEFGERVMINDVNIKTVNKVAHLN